MSRFHLFKQAHVKKSLVKKFEIFSKRIKNAFVVSVLSYKGRHAFFRKLPPVYVANRQATEVAQIKRKGLNFAVWLYLSKFAG